MIFLTIGTHEPFERLVRAVDDWCGLRNTGARVFGQIIGPKQGSWRPQNFEWVARLDPQDYDRRFRQAELIVSHAGMGSILTALHYSKPIVIMPRRVHLNEMRNDHQFATVKMLGNRRGIMVAEDETRLADVLDNALELGAGAQAAPISAYAEKSFTDSLRGYLTGQSKSEK